MARVSRRAAFLDRDGTLNERPPEHRYVTSAAQLVWLPGAATGAARLAAAGYVLAVASNQRGVALGLIDGALLRTLEGVIQRGLAEYGCAIEAFRYCPHDVQAQCGCRKPRAGLILRLAADLDLDLERSWMIGDSASDILAGKAAGCRTALVGTGPETCDADLVAPSLNAVSELVVRLDASLSQRVTSHPLRTPPRGRDTWSADRPRC
jgi:D-glycero-D-manno-heptose 1,7-bisphosphate phosphatase